MKAVFLILVLAATAYLGYTFLNRPGTAETQPVESEATPTPTPAHTPTPTPTPAPTPTPTPSPAWTPVARLAPAGVYYVVKPFSVTTESGINGFRVGKEVKLIKTEGGKMFVTDGEIEGSATSDHFTNDLNIVDGIRAKAASASQPVPPPAAGSVPPSAASPPDTASQEPADRRKTALETELANLNVQLAAYEARVSAARAELDDKGYNEDGSRERTRAVRRNVDGTHTGYSAGKLTSLSDDARNIGILKQAVRELQVKISTAEARLRNQ